MRRTRTIVVALTIFLLIGIVISFAWFKSPFYGRWAKNQYYGKIITIKDNSLVVLEGEKVERIVFIEPDTKIMAGPRAISPKELLSKTPIIIIGESDINGNIHARLIRTFPLKN